MPKVKAEEAKKTVEAVKARLAKAKETAKGNKYDPLYRTTKKKLKRAQRKFNTLSGRKLAFKNKKTE